MIIVIRKMNRIWQKRKLLLVDLVVGAASMEPVRAVCAAETDNICSASLTMKGSLNVDHVTAADSMEPVRAQIAAVLAGKSNPIADLSPLGDG